MMEFGLLLFVIFAIPFCVGAILGVLWWGRVKSLVLFVCGLAAVCVVGWVVWKLQTDPYKSMRDFRTFVGVTEFASKASLHFALAFWTCFVGGLGTFGAYFLKVWLRSRKIPPVLPANA